MADLIKHQSGPAGGILDHLRAYDTSKEHGNDEVVGIYQIAVWYANRIDKLQINWKTKNGTKWSEPIGGRNSGPPTQPNVIWPPDSQAGDPITVIQGNLGDHNSLRLFSIQFHTKDLDSSVYGTQSTEDRKNHYYYFQAPAGYQIVDLFGWADNEVDSLGVYFVPVI